MARVFILESPNPVDLLENRGERSSLESVCNLFGYDSAAFLLTNRSELEKALMYVREVGAFSGDLTGNGVAPLFIHISAHGDDNGISIGPDFVEWPDLAKLVVRMYSRLGQYGGPVILVLSSCGSKGQSLTRWWTKFSSKLREERGLNFVPPEYVFVFSDEEIDWRDSVVTWTIFYRKASELDFSSRSHVQQLLKQVARSGFGKLMYFRLDVEEKKYKRWGG